MSSYEEYNRGMISYTSRDYNTILEECKALCRNLTENWNPEADSDPGVVILKVLASCADILGVNTDWLANEVFAPSVSQRKKISRTTPTTLLAASASKDTPPAKGCI